MGFLGKFFSGGREVSESSDTDEYGREVHTFDDGDEVVEVTKASALDYIYNGTEWCPYCKIKCKHHKAEQYFECPQCSYSITDEEAEEGRGYPSKVAAEESGYIG